MQQLSSSSLPAPDDDGASGKVPDRSGDNAVASPDRDYSSPVVDEIHSSDVGEAKAGKRASKLANKSPCAQVGALPVTLISQEVFHRSTHTHTLFTYPHIHISTQRAMRTNAGETNGSQRGESQRGVQGRERGTHAHLTLSLPLIFPHPIRKRGKVALKSGQHAPAPPRMISPFNSG